VPSPVPGAVPLPTSPRPVTPSAEPGWALLHAIANVAAMHEAS
jgi:hypothetical protein